MPKEIRSRLVCPKLAFLISFLLFVPLKFQPAVAQTFTPDEVAEPLPLPENLPGVVDFLLFGWGISPEHHNRQILRQAIDTLHQGRRLKDSQDYSGAVAAYTEAIKLARDLQGHDESREYILTVAYLDLGAVYLNVGDYQKGIDQFYTALQPVDSAEGAESDHLQTLLEESEWDSLQTLLGFAYWKMGDIESAEKLLWRVIRLVEVRIMRPNLNIFATPQGQLDQLSVDEVSVADKAANLLQAIYIEQGNFTAALEIADRTRSRVLLDHLLNPFSDDIAPDISEYHRVADELAISSPQIQQLSESLSATLVAGPFHSQGRRKMLEFQADSRFP
jgi:tetratricopeptide (TPR) repeat protein